MSEENKNNDIFSELKPKNEGFDINNENPNLEDISNILNGNIKEQLKEENTSSIIFDINIKSIDDLISILLKNEYDFLAIEPNADYVKISFKKDSILKETKNIRFHIYSNILLQAKKISKLNLEDNTKEQKSSWEYEFNSKKLEVLSKTIPGELWESLFLKVKISEKKQEQKTQKKTITTSQAFWFLWAILLVALILGSIFLTFVVFNAQTPEDVAFFTNLWINLNDINSFLLKITTVIFSVFIIFESIILIISLFKAILTKKEFKRKKTIWTITGVFLTIVLFATWTLWITLDKAIKSLPNWLEMSYGNIQLFDNLLLTSEKFTKENSIITDYKNLIWPIDIKFDLKYLVNQEQRKWFKINKYIWDFWDGEKLETQSPEIIHTFNKKWIFKVKLTLEWVDNRFPNKITTKDVLEAPSIGINYLVDIKEQTLSNGWKTISFNAKDLQPLGQIEWYLETNIEKPVYEWYLFQPSKVYFEKELIWMKIKSDKNKNMDRIFVVSWETSDIKWEIDYEVSIDNDLSYTFIAKNIENSFWDGFIKTFKWIIWNREYIKQADFLNLEESSKQTFKFDTYGRYTIKLILINTAWKKAEITREIVMLKSMNLINRIDIYENNQKLEDVKYDDKTKEYFLYDIWVPTILKFDAKNVRSSNPLYYLDEVEWDIWSDWAIDGNWKYLTQNFDLEQFEEITVKYKFIHRRNEKEVIEVIEKINLEFITKEATLVLNMKSNSEYAPAIVSFDASLSKIKDDNIVKFIYDYGDGIVEERDAINPWHKYLREWNYIIKLTVVTESWKEYFTTKNLVLKPADVKVDIKASMRKAPVWQEIDFLSTWSIGQIVWYHWDFWDGNISKEANPSHAFKKPWIYNVKLTLDFANNNTLSNSIEIEIK